MAFFNEADEWRALGASFGLVPYRPTASYDSCPHFRQLKRALGVPAQDHAPSFDDWFTGRWNGVEVMLLAHTVQAGSNTQNYTISTARIDPPLFLGLNITAKPVFELFAPRPPVVTGNAFVDEKLRIAGYDHARVIRFLALDTADGFGFIQHVAANKNDLCISDSRATHSVAGYELDRTKVRHGLDLATHVASVLAKRRSTFPSSPAEEAQRAEWQRFATEVGMRFDPARMTLFGQVDGAHIKIALETTSDEVRTSVNVRFPRPVHVAFSVLRTDTPGLVQGLFGQDIKVGDSVFDEQYVITGHPEPLVREAIAKPALIDALKRLGAVTNEVHLNHGQLFFRVRDPLSTSAALRSVCETGRVACNALFAQVQGIGPYR